MGERHLVLFLVPIFFCISVSALAMQRDMLQADHECRANESEQAVAVCTLDQPAPLWRRVCTGTWSVLSRSTRAVAVRCWQRRVPLALMALLFCALSALPRVGGTSTDTSLAYGGPAFQPEGMDLQVDLCAELVGAISDFLRLNLLRCWPVGATHMNEITSEEIRACLEQDVGTINLPFICLDNLHGLLREYAPAVDSCLARCMSPSFSCLNRDYSPEVDPFLYCTGPQCLDECMCDTLPWSASRYTDRLIADALYVS